MTRSVYKIVNCCLHFNNVIWQRCDCLKTILLVYDHRLTEIANDSFIAVANEVVIRKSAYLQVTKKKIKINKKKKEFMA